jgi:hypothetical protein
MISHMRALILGLVVALLPGSADGHIPVFSSADSGSSADNAVFIDDGTISHAVYHEGTAEAPRLWVTYDLEAGQQIYAQLGVPVLDRLVDFRPAMAILGPGLPAVELPFDIPEGLGGILFTTDEIAEPEFFHEEFTGTDSWIFGFIEDTAPQTGTYYAVVYVPSGDLGKFWVAVGRRESFAIEDIFALGETVPRVSAFHETDATGILTPFLPCFMPVALVGAGFCGSLWLARRQRARTQR